MFNLQVVRWLKNLYRRIELRLAKETFHASSDYNPSDLFPRHFNDTLVKFLPPPVTPPPSSGPRLQNPSTTPLPTPSPSPVPFNSSALHFPRTDASPSRTQISAYTGLLSAPLYDRPTLLIS